MNALSDICNENYMDITPDMVSIAIGKLKCGKACGSDSLFAEHYIHADSRLAVLLSTFFTSALIHGHVPDAFMQSILVPLVKNKSGDSSDVKIEKCNFLLQLVRESSLYLFPRCVESFRRSRALVTS